MDEARSLLNHSTPSSPDESIQQLQSELAALRQQVSRLEQRLAAVEQSPASSGILPSAAAAPKLESRLGLTLVNRAGALTLAIGIIFFFKYAVDNQWIAAEGRVIIGVVTGLVLLLAAEWLQARGRRSPVPDASSDVFTQGISGCGLAILYAAIYAALAYYKLLLPAAGWLLLLLTSALAIFLSIRYRSRAIAALGFAGGLLTPILLRGSVMTWWFDLAYLLILGVTALFVSVRQRWLVLIPTLAGLTLLAAAISLVRHHGGWFCVFSLLLGAAHFLAARLSVADRPLATCAYITGHSCLLFASLRALSIWTAGDSQARDRAANDRYSFTSALESILLGLYGIGALVYGMLRASLRDRFLGLVLLGLVIAKLYLWDIWQLNRFYRISAFVALGILLLGASYFYSRLRSRPSPS